MDRQLEGSFESDLRHGFQLESDPTRRHREDVGSDLDRVPQGFQGAASEPAAHDRRVRSAAAANPFTGPDVSGASLKEQARAAGSGLDAPPAVSDEVGGHMAVVVAAGRGRVAGVAGDDGNGRAVLCL